MAEQDLGAIARTIIDANRYMTLATADSQGQPWASPVFYASANYTEFYWISAPEATHSRNLAQRPEISIAIFDSTAPEGAGQAVYLSATAEQVPDDDLDRALAVYPGSAEGKLAAHDNREQLQAPAPYRLYRATAYEWSVLCPRDTGPRGTGACTPHGLPFDHRIQVRVAG
jgi:pyridoxine/pyridoxamine 5'-phosphate oxidase